MYKMTIKFSPSAEGSDFLKDFRERDLHEKLALAPKL